MADQNSKIQLEGMVTTMKIYIAGAITGDPEYREKFRRAEEAVRAEGHVAVNPAVLPEGLEPGDYMRICTAMLDSCDAIALLRDWAHSKGACIEMTYAQYVGKKLMRLWDMPDGLWLRDQVTPEALAAALRCSAAEDVHETHCETCPYYDLTGEYDEGECDVDRMALDAAAMIEELSGRDV